MSASEHQVLRVSTSPPTSVSYSTCDLCWISITPVACQLRTEEHDDPVCRHWCLGSFTRETFNVSLDHYILLTGFDRIPYHLLSTCLFSDVPAILNLSQWPTWCKNFYTFLLLPTWYTSCIKLVIIKKVILWCTANQISKFLYIYYNPLHVHVSSNVLLILRRSNCI